ncbi:hypothetical protein [Legionella rowbothamii]|uniref:hypothetical protein n=1 Tax=Legionella rowbothamii TaxID=96229 RepID=UPI00105582C3|nr:hypothetical protein [Legionella rowbothamii]
MRKSLICILLLLITYQVSAKNSNYTVCKNKFALCTTALCDPIPGKKGWVSCHCSVQKGYSAGTESCSSLEKSTKGSLIKSRYYPIKSYAICKNDRPWAWCLDSPCKINKSEPNKATCLCSLVKNKGDYVIVTDAYNDTTCTTGVHSSATIKGAEEVRDFLKTNEDLQPFDIKILN